MTQSEYDEPWVESKPLVSWLKRLHVPPSLSSVLLLCVLGGPFVILSIELAEPAQKWPGKALQLTVQVTEAYCR
jgi:hypothetical protein